MEIIVNINEDKATTGNIKPQILKWLVSEDMTLSLELFDKSDQKDKEIISRNSMNRK